MFEQFAAVAIPAIGGALKGSPAMPGYAQSRAEGSYITVDGLTVHKGPEGLSLIAGAAVVGLLVWGFTRR